MAKRGRDAIHPILRKLEGRDLRSIGRSNEVVGEVTADPAQFDALFSGLRAADPVLRARAADAVEKITARHPEYLRPHKEELIGALARAQQKEVRWHVAQMLPRIDWNRREQRRVLDILTGYLEDESSIVKTCAMQALADLAQMAPGVMPDVLPRLQVLSATGTPAMKARGRKLLVMLRASTGHSGARRKTRSARSGR